MFKIFFNPEATADSFIVEQINNYINNIAIMASYASETGKDLEADNLAGKISGLIEIKGKQIKDSPDSLYTKELLKEAIEVHSKLSKIIAPLTATSLSSTQPGFLTYNHVLKFIIISTIFSLIFMILFLFLSDIVKIETKYRSLLIYGQVIVAAWLGSGVYCLWTARRYLIDRTFEPRYNPTYVMRLILGIALGTILGLFGENMIDGKGEILTKLGQVVLAIVGGFSSDAVARILERIADTLQALVRGSNKDEIEKESDRAKSEEKNKALNLLLELKNKVSKAAMTEAEQKEIMNSIDKYIGS